MPPSLGRKPRTALCGARACLRAYNTAYRRARRVRVPAAVRLQRYLDGMGARWVLRRARIKHYLFEEVLACGHEQLSIGKPTTFRVCRTCREWLRGRSLSALRSRCTATRLPQPMLSLSVGYQRP
jgi:hypothetical protein